MLGKLIPATIPPVNRMATHLLSAREYTAPSHEVFVSPRRVRFKEMEYALPIENLRPAFAEIRRWIDSSGERISFPLEVRVAAADDIWLSTAEGRTTAYLAVHQYYRTDHRRFFTAAEDILWSHAGRPHWAKLHTRTATDLRPRYPNFDRFLECPFPPRPRRPIHQPLPLAAPGSLPRRFPEWDCAESFPERRVACAGREGSHWSLANRRLTTTSRRSTASSLSFRDHRLFTKHSYVSSVSWNGDVAPSALSSQ